jgi:intracellular sulfur oxidation DsrE/DsrF family protein
MLFQGVKMKKWILGLFLIVGFAYATPVQKAVFDCAAKDMGFVSSRIWLIEESAKELKAKNIPYALVLTIHSGCTPIIDKTDDDKMMKTIHKRLETLVNNYGVKVEACGIAVDRYGYEKEEILPFISTVKNSITRVIELQNSGYALIPYH